VTDKIKISPPVRLTRDDVDHGEEIYADLLRAHGQTFVNGMIETTAMRTLLQLCSSQRDGIYPVNLKWALTVLLAHGRAYNLTLLVRMAEELIEP
jgi:hypothetical protein